MTDWAAELEHELGMPVVVHGSVDSTMSMAELDERAAVVHIAKTQRRGQGRRGRVWISPPGNLYATIAWPEGPEPLPPSVLAAVQIEWAERVAAAGGPRLLCKWPNDGILADGKWSGLLARSLSVGPPRLLMGLGANLEAHPGEIPGGLPASRLADHWHPWPGFHRVAAELLCGAIDVLREGSAGIRQRLMRWPLHDALVPGEPVTIQRGEECLHGCYEGVDRDGRLCWLHRGHHETLTTGEVNRLRRPGAPKP